MTPAVGFGLGTCGVTVRGRLPGQPRGGGERRDPPVASGEVRDIRLDAGYLAARYLAAAHAAALAAARCACAGGGGGGGERAHHAHTTR
jgi:hypothetical protein